VALASLDHRDAADGGARGALQGRDVSAGGDVSAVSEGERGLAHGAIRAAPGLQ
jgi:hypothetical protein